MEPYLYRHRHLRRACLLFFFFWPPTKTALDTGGRCEESWLRRGWRVAANEVALHDKRTTSWLPTPPPALSAPGWGKGCEAFAALARAIPVCLLAPADTDLGLPFALSPRHLQSQGLGNTKSLLANDTIRN